MKSFLRENTMIVVSIALPLLVVILFALARIVPGLYSQPPEHDLLLTHLGRGVANEIPVKISLTVQDQRLVARIIKSKESTYGNLPRIFRYYHLTGEVREINIPIPANVTELPEGSEIPVPELAATVVSNALQAPDGYEFRGHRRGGGLMMELFDGNRNRHDVTIARKGAIIRIRLPATDYWYGNVRFLGWIIQ